MELYPRGMPIRILIWIRHHVSCIPESELCSRKRQHWLVKVICYVYKHELIPHSGLSDAGFVFDINIFFFGRFCKEGCLFSSLYTNLAQNTIMHYTLIMLGRISWVLHKDTLQWHAYIEAILCDNIQHNCVIFIQQFRKQEVYTD